MPLASEPGAKPEAGSTAVHNMTILQGFRNLFSHVPKRRKWQGLVVLGLMFVGAFAELVTIGAVLPFLALISNPDAATSHHGLASLLGYLGLRGRSQSILGLGLVFCVVAIVAAGIRIFLAWASQKYVFRIGYDLGVSLYERMLYQPYSFHVSQNSSRIVSSVNKIQKILTGMLKPMMQGLTAVIIAGFIIGGLIFIDSQLALVSAVGFTLIYVGVSIVTRRRLRRNSLLISKSSTQRIKAVQEGLGGIRDVLIDSSQPIYVKKFAKIDTTLRDAQATNALITVVPRFVVESLGMIMIVLLAILLNSRPGGLTQMLPVLGALALGAQRLLPLLQQAFTGWTAVMGNRAMFFDILELLDRPMPAAYKERHRAEPLPFEDHIELNRVEFRYFPDADLVLEDISLSIPKGARIGFIGKTGSGKSTLMDLMMGLLEKTSGSLKVDGVELDTLNLARWQAQVAHVPQNIYLSDASFLENVAFGVRPQDVDEQRVIEACRRADIHDFIMSHKDGYRHEVGERGVRLSGGQRQRIGIARALYKQSSILILDEATSALDDRTEEVVVQAVERLGRDITVLMIAHRLTTLRNCDIIYKLENGRIVQSGRYDEVVGGTGDPALGSHVGPLQRA